MEADFLKIFETTLKKSYLCSFLSLPAFSLDYRSAHEYKTEKYRIDTF